MAGTGNARGGLGWVILVIALAVPGVLFYNWWSRLKAEREKTVATKAHSRVPEGGVFQASSPNTNLVNPMAPAVSTMTETAVAAAAPEIAPASESAPQSAEEAVDGQEPAEDAESSDAVQSAMFSTSTVTALPLKRDPTLSPFDQVRIIEAEEARRRAAEALENMKQAKRAGSRPKKAKAVNPRTLVELQGIISTPAGKFMAIVNNEVMNVGQSVGSTQIKIVKITDLGVTFDYRGTRFVKSVSQE